jgi:hypothetical protein
LGLNGKVWTIGSIGVLVFDSDARLVVSIGSNCWI